MVYTLELLTFLTFNFAAYNNSKIFIIMSVFYHIINNIISTGAKKHDFA